MTGYLYRLSRAQIAWLIGSLVAAVVVCGIGTALEPRGRAGAPSLTTAMTLRQMASRLDTTGKALAKELNLPLEVSKDTAVAELGVRQETLDAATSHLASHRGSILKYFVFAALVLWGLVFLVRLGRPDGATNAERKAWYPRAAYIASLVLAVAICGFALGKSPNPMEGVVKVFKAMVGLQPSVAATIGAFVFFLAAAIVGNKLVCGWACPFGALQELVYSLPILRRLKRWKVPFWCSNLVRVGLFVVMLLLLFGIVGGKRGFVLYHGINPFNLFNLHFESASMAIAVVVALLAGLVIYRPFCQFICPFGLISWLTERFSLARVRIDPERCNQCGACSRACPLDAAKDRVAGKVWAADCYSCARCLNVCPHDAITYGFTVGRAVHGNDTAGKS
jgi:ferredoxin